MDVRRIISYLLKKAMILVGNLETPEVLVRVITGCPSILQGAPEVVLALRCAVQFVPVHEVVPVLTVALWFEIPVDCTGQCQRILVDSVGRIPLLPLFDDGRSELVE